MLGTSYGLIPDRPCDNTVKSTGPVFTVFWKLSPSIIPAVLPRAVATEVSLGLTEQTWTSSASVEGAPVWESVAVGPFSAPRCRVLREEPLKRINFAPNSPPDSVVRGNIKRLTKP